MDDDKSIINLHKIFTIITTLILPAYASLYFFCWLIWDFPAVGMVLGVTALITLFCGLILQAGSAVPDGQIVIKQDLDGKKTFLLELNKDPEQLELMDVVTFKVKEDPTPGYDDLAD